MCYLFCMSDSINLNALTPDQLKALASAQHKLLIYFLKEFGSRIEDEETLDLKNSVKLTDDEWPLVALLVNRRRPKPDMGVGSWSCLPWEVVVWLESEIAATAPGIKPGS